MSTYSSSRSSGGSASSNGSSSYQLILDHILTYPGSYEIPLRTMYSLNCQPRGSGSPSCENSPTIQQDAFPDTEARATFTRNLMAQLSNLPNQAATLPPSFITAFVQRCFPSELTHVDFPQALTGLDYLKDLEARRRREVGAALDRLDITRDTLANNATELSETYPGILQWIRGIEDKERKIDTLYTQIYVGLRRWIIINELSLRPFSKHNCIAMLNTLYPPMGQPTQPSSKLTPTVLKQQRDGFFKYIQSVEKNGPGVLSSLINQGKAPTDHDGWPAVTRILSMYLQLANSIISDCNTIGYQSSSPVKRDSNQSRHTRKADSGISFTSETSRPPTRNSNEPPSPVEPSRPKTPAGPRPGTALEKLARGLKGIGRSRTDVTEMIGDSTFPAFPPPEKQQTKMLRKMRSLGSLSDRRPSTSNGASKGEPAAPAFNIEEMRRQRARYEASIGVSRPNKRASN